MTGWNLPPGCNVSDIPGNRPDDEWAEELAEKIDKILNPLNLTEKTHEEAAEYLFGLVQNYWHEGLDTGIDESKLAVWESEPDLCDSCKKVLGLTD